MKLEIDKNNWERVKLGDVFTKKEENDKVSAQKRFDRFMKVEHMDKESLHIKRWSSQENGDEINPTFYKIFRKGQVLFPTRNPHLRRTALASFDGICGEKTLTLEPNKEALHPEFIPFLFHSESFYAHTTGAIVGSTNPHVRWRDVANYEFLLPPKDQQKQLAELLWAMDDVIEKEKKVLGDMNKMKSSALKAFHEGNINDSIHKLGPLKSAWPYVKLGEYAIIKGRIGWRGLKQSEYVDHGPFMIAGKHIQKGKVEWSKCDMIPMDRYEESMEIALKVGDVIFSKDGAIGNPALIRELPGKATLNSTMMLLRPNGKLDSEYLYQTLLSVYFERLKNRCLSGSAIPHIFQGDMKNFEFPLPPLSEQNRIGRKLNEIDLAFENIESKITSSKALQKSLINQIF